MSDVDVQTAHDLKAGYSTICRAGNHRTCHDLKARPTAMSEATVTTLPSSPANPTEHECPECGRTFERTQALGRHRSVFHGVAGKPRTSSSSKPAKTAPPPTAKVTKAARPAAPPKRAAEMVPERDLLNVLAVAYHELTDASIGQSIDSAATVLDAITANGWTVVKATS